MNTVEEIRKSCEAWIKYKNQYGDLAEIRRHPVRQWKGHTYIVTGKIDLREGSQEIMVIDITPYADEVALFANMWPESQKREYAIVIFPEEGYTQVLMEDGGEVRVHELLLRIRVEPPTIQDYEEIENEEMEKAMQFVHGLFNAEANGWF